MNFRLISAPPLWQVRADARGQMREYRQLAADAPDALTAWLILTKAPPAPFVPTEWHGREVLIIALCYAGPIADGEAAAAPFRALGKPIIDLVGPHPFVGWQTAFDPLLAPGAQLLEEPRLPGVE
jgi:hypothetical protein